jgi:uncharacterized protein (DUF433 family)
LHADAREIRERKPLSSWSSIQDRFVCVKLESVIRSDPDILGGTPVFLGTRVLVQSLFDHLESGDSIDEFLEGFPSVRRDQVIAVLEESRKELLQPA